MWLVASLRTELMGGRQLLYGTYDWLPVVVLYIWLAASYCYVLYIGLVAR